MEAARRIASNAELRAIAEAGTGYVVDPFNRWWHVATCPRISNMTVGEAKWFAPTRPALDAYLEDRLASYPTAKPILGCKGCAGSETSGARTASVQPPDTAGVVAAQMVSGPHVERSASGFAVWADECVRNESKAASTAGALRRLIADGVRALPAPNGRVLYATYAGERARGTDVENLLFNNIDQTLSLFRASGAVGVRFEDLGVVASPAPDGANRMSVYGYRLVDPREPFATVGMGDLICRVPDAVVPDGSARLAARVWFAVRSARREQGTSALLEAGDYVLKITVRGLDPAKSIKAVVDGASAAMQRDEPERLHLAMRRLSLLLEVDEERLLDLATAPGAPLGTRSRPKPTSKDCLFTLDGATQVRVTPDDDRCVAAEVLASGDCESSRLTVEVYAAKRR
jgi:hypothetical protein